MCGSREPPEPPLDPPLKMRVKLPRMQSVNSIKLLFCIIHNDKFPSYPDADDIILFITYSYMYYIFYFRCRQVDGNKVMSLLPCLMVKKLTGKCAREYSLSIPN